MLKRILAALAVIGLIMASSSVTLAAAQTVTPSQEQDAEQARWAEIVASLNRRTGQVAISEADATLSLGDAYYFLDSKDARTVLTELWGNPPSAVDGVLGMVFPQGLSPLDDTWGVVVTYTGDGYVSDDDAAEIDPAKLLTSLREGEDENNRQRQADGFATVHLAGWAQPPLYDAQKHNLIWAKILKFGDAQDQTLNYDVRVLGRRGVLSLNIVAGEEDLSIVGPAAATLMNTVSFDAGSRYVDYQPGVDKKATYGVAALVAGGAALAVAKKVGFVGILLLVLKKGGVFLIAGLGAVWAWFRRRFGRGDKSVARDQAPITPEPDPDLALSKPEDEAAPDNRS